MKTDLSHISVTVESASGLNGVYPFVVACYDNDLRNELYKTSAAESGGVNVWEESFEVNLVAEEKSRKADNRPPPVYLTFFIYDTGAPGAPSLGSAGVLLDTVRQNGVASGEFPVVHGSGALKLTVSAVNEGRAWYKTNTAKISAGVVGAGALAGLAAMAVGSQKKKKKKQRGAEEEQVQQQQQQEQHEDGEQSEDSGPAGTTAA